MATLLIEIQTEELPPKALENLSSAFAASLFDSLKEQGFTTEDSKVTAFGAPRRIAAEVTAISERSPDKPFRQKLVPAKIGLDADGNATAALKKKMAALGIECEPSQLAVVNDGKQDQLYYDGIKPGVLLAEGLQTALDKAVKQLPIPKVMSYQLEDGRTVEFVRPVKHLVALLDDKVVDVELFGLKAGRETRGHRFHCKAPVEITSAESYVKEMEAAKVIPSFDERRNKMVQELKDAAKRLDAEIIMPQDLVNEVAALTEWPVVYDSSFDEEFLSVPEECLILTMQQNQKYFALRDQNGKLKNRFLLVSQIEATDGGDAIRSGNAVWCAQDWRTPNSSTTRTSFSRLSREFPDSLMWFTTTSLAHSSKEANVFAKSLNKSPRRLMRIRNLPTAPRCLAKADLRTLMVGEFPELQGIMGEYYAEHDKEDAKVALAIREHYQPRYAGDELPSTRESLAVALADKMETLAGLFGIGQLPTGEKDPFALRRHALGVLRMLMEKELPLSLDDLIQIAMQIEMTAPGVKDTSDELRQFFTDRLRVMLKDKGYSAHEVESVIEVRPELLSDIPKRLKAVHDFMGMPEAESLAAANKRIENILKKSSRRNRQRSGCVSLS